MLLTYLPTYLPTQFVKIQFIELHTQLKRGKLNLQILFLVPHQVHALTSQIGPPMTQIINGQVRVVPILEELHFGVHTLLHMLIMVKVHMRHAANVVVASILVQLLHNLLQSPQACILVSA